jgi:hypothetical protein
MFVTLLCLCLWLLVGGLAGWVEVSRLLSFASVSSGCSSRGRSPRDCERLIDRTPWQGQREIRQAIG